MQRMLLTSVIILSSLLSLSACKTTQEEGPKVSYLKDQHLYSPGPSGGVDRILLGAGIKDINELESVLAQYNRIKINPIIIAYNKGYAYKGLSPSELESLGETFRATLADAVRGRYSIVSKPQSPSTLLLTVALTGLEGVSMSKEGQLIMKSASIEATIIDAGTNQSIVAVIDNYSNAGQNAFEWWAQRLSAVIDSSNN